MLPVHRIVWNDITGPTHNCLCAPLFGVYDATNLVFGCIVPSDLPLLILSAFSLVVVQLQYIFAQNRESNTNDLEVHVMQ